MQIVSQTMHLKTHHPSDVDAGPPVPSTFQMRNASNLHWNLKSKPLFAGTKRPAWGYHYNQNF